MRRLITPAVNYQDPRAPIRLLADRNQRELAVDFAQALIVGRKNIVPDHAAFLIRHGRWREVYGLINWSAYRDALRVPLNRIADIALEAATIGAANLSVDFGRKRKMVRIKKAAALREEWSDRGLSAAESNHASADGKLSQSVRKDIGDGFDFDRFDEMTIARIRDYQNRFIAELGREARNTIEKTILAGLLAGKSAEEIVGDVRQVVGLTETQARAVLAFERQLREGDSAALGRALIAEQDKRVLRDAFAAERALRASEIAGIVERYEENYLGYRANMIAQTESTRAASVGLQESYLQAVERGVLPKEAVRQEWKVALDEKTCPVCLSIPVLNKDGIPLGQSFKALGGKEFKGPPAHPNCRCSIDVITNLDLVPDDYAG